MLIKIPNRSKANTLSLYTNQSPRKPKSTAYLLRLYAVNISATLTFLFDGYKEPCVADAIVTGTENNFEQAYQTFWISLVTAPLAFLIGCSKLANKKSTDFKLSSEFYRYGIMKIPCAEPGHFL